MEFKDKSTLKRWEMAQKSEKEFWRGHTTKSLMKEHGDRYPKKTKILLKEWSKFTKINKNTKTLQIGCGPEDVINHIFVGKRYSIDPLAEFYKNFFNFDYKSTNLIEGAGEKIPFKDKFFDIVILINVLDHVHVPDIVLDEISRVLKDNGIFHFENYIYQKRFIQIGKFWGKLKEIFTGEIFNIHHPYMFTVKDIKSLMSKNFSLLHEEIGKDIGLYGNIKELKEKAKKDRKLGRRILAKFGLIGRINYTCVSKKN